MSISFSHRAVGLSLLCLSLIACSGPKSPAGAWSNEDGTQTLEFLENGDFFWVNLDGTVAGRWEAPEKGTLKLSFARQGIDAEPASCTYTIKKDVLDIADPCPVKGQFNRKPRAEATDS